MPFKIDFMCVLNTLYYVMDFFLYSAGVQDKLKEKK